VVTAETPAAPQFPFEEDEQGAAGGTGGLLLTLDGYDGPIDLLLSLARDQKVDLAKISILALADQYLAFVAQMQREQLELAADYLVMAAWLAYLKSRLLLPEPAPEDQPSGEDMAAALAFQLLRLEAMQKAGQALMRQPLLYRERFPRGEPEETAAVLRTVFDATLYDLLRAYADIKRREAASVLEIEAPDLYSVDDAIRRLEEMLGALPDWASLESFLPPRISNPLRRRSAVSAHFVALLELTKQGRLELRQEGGAFAPLYLRKRVRAPDQDLDQEPR